MSAPRSIEARVEDLEAGVAELVEALTQPEEGQGEALERMHERFKARLRGEPV